MPDRNPAAASVLDPFLGGNASDVGTGDGGGEQVVRHAKVLTGTLGSTPISDAKVEGTTSGGIGGNWTAARISVLNR